MSLTGALRKLKSRSAAERRLLLAATARLAWARAMVRRRSLQHIASRLRLETGECGQPATADQLAAAARVGRAIVTVAARTPWRSACLEQAVVAAALLRRGGIPGTLYLGVAKNAAEPEGIAAHAWVRCGDLVVTGAGGHERFAVVGAYRW